MARSPLFDLYDPYGLIQQRVASGLLPEDDDEETEIIGAFERPRSATISDLMPAEEKRGMLRTLADAGTSGLAALGWLLDWPGALVRGTLAGKPLSAFGTSEERVSGRDLARQYGLVGKDDTWGNFAGGMAAEVVLDPLTYFNPLAILGKGATSAASRAASRASLLDDAALLAKNKDIGIREFYRTRTPRKLIDEAGGDAAQRFETAARGVGLNPEDLLDRPLAGLAEFRIPGFESGLMFSGGRTGDSIARGLDKFGDALKTTPGVGPVVNRLTATFDPTVLGEVDPDQQWVMRRASAAKRDAQRAARGDLASLEFDALRADTSSLPEGLRKFTDQRVLNAVADLVEAGGDIERIIDTEAANAVLSIPAWRNLYEEFASRGLDRSARARLRGLPLPVWKGADETEFFPSQSVWFNTEKPPALPKERIGRQERPYTRGNRALNLDENFSRSRDPAYDLKGRRQAFRALMAGDYGRKLQAKLLAAEDRDIPGIIDEAFKSLRTQYGDQKIGNLYEDLTNQVANADATIADIEKFLADPTISDASRRPQQVRLKAEQAKAAALRQQLNDRKIKLGDLLRQADTQFADRGMGLFDGSSFDDMYRYEIGRSGVEANAKVVADELINAAKDIPADQHVGGGYIPLSKAVTDLGFDADLFKNVLKRAGKDADITQLSVTEKQVKALKRLMPADTVPEDSLLSRAYDTFTNAFKIGALANPAYHTRNLYSGQFSNLMGGEIKNPFTLAFDSYAGWQAGKGNYGPLLKRLRSVERYRNLGSDEDILRQFAMDTGRNRLGQGEITDMAGDAAQSTRGLYPGAAQDDPTKLFGEGGLLYDKGRKLGDWWTVRGVDAAGVLSGAATSRNAPAQTLNPFLRLHERVGRQVEDANRIGAFISMLRRGADPDAAARYVYKTQIDYAPEAFTAAERQIKRWVPFYSYTRGIAPLVAENLLYRPGGLQGQSIRAVTRASEPNEDSFVPEYLRQSAAIPIPGAPAEGLQRFLTNIDLPYEGLVNLFSPGVGNTATQRATSTLQKTGMNLLGQLNPAIKAPLEYILNRQLYTGRELSDLYSVLEQDLGPIGRPLEQLFVNYVPGGTKLNSIYRTLRDERLSPGEKATKLAINNLLGAKVTDVDQERTRRLAARQMLQEMLETTPGVRTYENIVVPEDVLAQMPENQRKQYLLYRVIQAEAAKRAREKKKQEAAIDPLQFLGVTQRF